MEWQPIETAPKDGTEILVYGQWCGEIGGEYEDKHLGVARYSYGRWSLVLADCYLVVCEPTHWMQPPTPPKDTP